MKPIFDLPFITTLRLAITVFIVATWFLQLPQYSFLAFMVYVMTFLFTLNKIEKRLYEEDLKKGSVEDGEEK